MIYTKTVRQYCHLLAFKNQEKKILSQSFQFRNLLHLFVGDFMLKENSCIICWKKNAAIKTDKIALIIGQIHENNWQKNGL